MVDLSQNIKKNFFQLAGALMEHFIEGIPQILYLELFNQSLLKKTS